MVEYTLVLEIGQSNASPVGDIQGWEDKHPQIAIRSPNTARSEVKQFSTGSYRDDFTLAATFKGGPQVGDVGTEMGAAINGQWQSANLRGVAVDAVRVATFYNPVATLQTTAGHARSWPGTYNVVPTTNALTPNTAREFSTNFIVQAGREHRVAASISGATITSTGTATFAVNDIVVFSADFAALGLANRGPFKVTAVAGADFDIQTWPEGATVSATATATVSVWKVNNTAAPFLITRKRTGSTHTYAPTGLGNGGGARLVVDPPFTPAQSDEEEFTVPMSLQRDAGGTGNPLVFDAFLGGFVNNNPAVTISAEELTTATSGYRWFVPSGSPLRGGRAVSGEAGTPATVSGVMHYEGDNSTWGAALSSSDGVATFATEPPIQNAEPVRLTTTGTLPGTLSTATTYYARNVRQDVSNDDFLPVGTTAAYIALGSSMDDQVYKQYEPVRLVAGSGGLPTGLDENTTYYTYPVAPSIPQGIVYYGIALVLSVGSTTYIQFDGSTSGSGTHTIRRLNSFNLSVASTGALLDFSSTGGSGTHSVIRSTVTASANHNLVTGSPLLSSADTAKVPGGLATSTAYFAIRVSDTEFKVAASLVAANAGTAIELTTAPSSGTGEWTVPYATGTLWPTRQLAPVVPPALTSGQTLNNYVVVSTPQEFAVGEQVRVSYGPTQGFPPTTLPAGDYYVVEVDTSVTGSERLRLATGKGGTALDIVWVGTVGDSPSIERINAYVGWLVSSERGGADWKNIAVPAVGVVTLAELDRFAGSLTGLRLRCASGANQGQWKHGKHITRDSTSTLTQVHYDGNWATAPSRNDIFVVEPTPVGDQERPFRKFCQLLPWAPFEGLARGSREAGPASVTVTSGVEPAGRIVVQGMFAPDRTSVRFYTTGTLPNGLTPGKTYYSALAVGNAFTIAATYGGAELQKTTDTGSGLHYAETVDNDNGFNPHPPGFNYPSQFAMPRRYMPFDGYVAGSFYGEETSQQASGVTAGMQLSFDLYNYTGRRSLFVPLAFGNTSIAHREVHQAGDGRSAFGWHDPNQQISWAPGEDNGCFARLEDTLDGVKLALTEEGSTVKDVVVHFNQGEADATEEYTSTTYRQNLNRLKLAVRQALYDRGLSPIKAERIKWLHATINESLKVWVYAKTVNAAIEAEAQADPYSRALVGTDLEVHAERDTFEGNPTADGLHYHGAEMDTLGKRAFVAYKALERSGYNETEVCNMALSYLGEPGRMVNVDTDTSREAELCRQFLPLARDELLERHPWDFALRSVKPTKRSASPRVDYRYAYDYPEGVASVLGLVRSDVNYNYKTMGTTGQHEYTVELDDNGDRMVLTDLDEALMLYVAKVTDPTKWSTTFTSALAWRLVFHLAGAILKGEEGSKKALAATEMAERALRTATKHDGDNKRDVDISNHVPTFLRHRSNPGSYRR